MNDRRRKVTEHVSDAGVIVEIGGNHEGDVSYAYKLVDSAIAAGGKNIKLQSYTGPSLVNAKIDPGRAQHFARFALPYDDQVKIAEYVIASGASFMSSLWDEESFEVLNPYIEVHKIGSGDLTNFQMIRRLCETNKPLIISTAMANIQLIKSTVDFITDHFPSYHNSSQLALLHCVAMYGDLQDEHAHLSHIINLKDNFPDLCIGYSDHTSGVVASILAIGMGAEIIEVHFTDNKNRAFRDHHLSVDAHELRLLLDASSRAKKLRGSGVKDVIRDVETPARIREFRRACYFARDLSAGHTIESQDLVCLRPNEGISASNFYDLVGRKLKADVPALAPLAWDLFE